MHERKLITEDKRAIKFENGGFDHLREKYASRFLLSSLICERNKEEARKKRRNRENGRKKGKKEERLKKKIEVVGKCKGRK